MRVKVSYFLNETLKIFNDFSQENHGHGGHEHGVRRGVFGGKLLFKKMSAGGRLFTLQENPHFWVPTFKVRPPDDTLIAGTLWCDTAQRRVNPRFTSLRICNNARSHTYMRRVCCGIGLSHARPNQQQLQHMRCWLSTHDDDEDLWCCRCWNGNRRCTKFPSAPLIREDMEISSSRTIKICRTLKRRISVNYAFPILTIIRDDQLFLIAVLGDKYIYCTRYQCSIEEFISPRGHKELCEPYVCMLVTMDPAQPYMQWNNTTEQRRCPNKFTSAQPWELFYMVIGYLSFFPRCITSFIH